MPTVRRRNAKSAKKKSSSSSRDRKAETELTLPDKPNKPPELLGDSVICIYGRKGIGKTTLAAKIEREAKTFVLMAEKGRRNLEIFQRSPKNFEEAIEYRDLFLGSDKFDLLVADTIDRVHEMAMQYVCKEAGVQSILKAPMNDRPALWGEVSATFGGFFWPILEEEKGLILISHEQIRELENRKVKGLKNAMYLAQQSDDEDDDDDSAVDIGKIERIQPSCSPAAFREIEQICNFVFYYGYMGRQRTITVRDPGDYAWVSSGDDEHFLDPDGNPLFSFAVGGTPDKAYEDLIAAFNNEKRDINYRPPRRKTPTSKKRRSK